MDKGRRKASDLAREFIEMGDSTGWFEPVYSGANWDTSQIPWADLAANPYLEEWTQDEELSGAGRRALVVGCGLGDDAEALAALGFDTVAFDISTTAIEWCQSRFPNSPVQYVVADLLSPPEAWDNRFDFVLEINTLQALPPSLRPRAERSLAQFLVPGGTLLVIARRRDTLASVGTAPWTMLREDLNYIRDLGLQEVTFEEFPDWEDPLVNRFRAEYRKA